MSNVLNRTTKQFLRSVNEPDYPTSAWIHNPDMAAVTKQDGTFEREEYWTITGDIVTLKSPAEQAIVDAAIDQATTVSQRNEAADKPDQPNSDTRCEIEARNKRDNYLINRIIQLQDAMDAMKASTGAVANMRDAIPAVFLPTNTRTRAEAIQDYKDDTSAGVND